jgi:N-methylhydantoinase B
MAGTFDPLLVELIRNELAAVTEEMAIAIGRTGRSMQIKIGDCATALADERGRCIAEGGAPFQTASLIMALAHARAKFGDDIAPGDVFLLNDPYAGMSHMPDCGVIAPVFWKGQLAAFTPTYSHHTDMGGRFPGSFTSAGESSFEEGLRIPVVKLYAAGKRNDAVVDLIAANVRNPDDWIGDLEAKVAGCRAGAAHVERLLDKYGLDVYRATCDYLQEHSERRTRAVLQQIPVGDYVSEDVYDEDGQGHDAHMALKLTLWAQGNRIVVDLTGTAPQAKGGVNVPFGMTTGFIYGPLRTLLGPDVILNEGFMRAIEIVAPEGTLFNPRFPAAVAGRAPLAHRLGELMYRSLAQALPDRVGVAGGAGDLIHFSGYDETGRFISFMDLFTGGWGARPHKDGIDAVAPLTFRGGSAPVELVEREYPAVVDGYGLLPDTEGAGKYRGALSTYRDWRFLRSGKVLIRSDHLVQPWRGMAGGEAGALAYSVLESGTQKTVLPPHAHLTIEVKAGDKLRHVVSGAGGFGNPRERDPELVLRDVRAGKVSPAKAAATYGVAIDRFAAD